MNVLKELKYVIFLASSGSEFQSFAAWNLKLLLPNIVFLEQVCIPEIEQGHEKTCLRGFRPGKTQTSLLSYRDKLILKFWIQQL